MQASINSPQDFPALFLPEVWGTVALGGRGSAPALGCSFCRIPGGTRCYKSSSLVFSLSIEIFVCVTIQIL